MKNLTKRIIKNLPYLHRMVVLYVPPGHFYSPIPCLEELKLKEQNIFHEFPREIPGIELNEKHQLELFETFEAYYNEQPFPVQKREELRYYFDNYFYSYSDAIFLYCMIRHARPRRIVEVGSGYSSCVILDTNEIFLNNTVNCTFIEPYPQRLLSLVKEDDKSHFELIEKNLQDVDLKQFQQLSNDDILFIDSTHVSKTNSDVNYILFKILPSLQSGVLIHFHDILYPFEYPKAWLYEGRAWNEAYILRSFLQYNSSFKIEFFNTFLEHFNSELFFEKMPLCMKNTGASIWLRKL